ncbi:alpha/beta hydrolase [Leptothermofonsia sp. ETS-13]|uniref:alpha/beta hydrolase n=1 Tax=Leptothermofonsia sp. ETS-13 TaxID=3035696 RepID=UPI003BA379E8
MTRPTIWRRLFGTLTVGRMVRSLLFIYLALGLYGFFFADGLIFRPRLSSYRDNQEIIKLITANGARISGLYLSNSQAIYTLLYSHGNGEDLGDVRPILEQIRKIGFAIFAYDYQGYGTSEGTPSEQNAYRDIDAAYQYLITNLNRSPQQIIVYGRSVGGGPSVDLARREPVAGLILESTFTSAFRVITAIPLYPFDRFNNIGKIGAVHCPVLFIHGTRDRIIPFWHSRGLFKRANEPKQFFAVDGADHNNVMEVAGEQYARAMREFAQLVDRAKNKKPD